MAYSHSKLKVFEECALRYRYKYVDKIPEPKVAVKPALFFGTIIHSALELLYKKIQTSHHAPTSDELKKYIQEEMEKSRNEHDMVSDIALSKESFDDYLKLSESIIDWYYENYAPFQQGSINALEKMFSYDLANGQKLTGIIDRFDINGDTATIIDYKTDKEIKPITEFSLSHEQQMTSYAARVMANYPHVVKKIRGKLIYLRLGHEVERAIEPEAIQKAIQIITEKISTIEHTLFAYNMGEKEAFGPNEGPQCRWCAYQVMCPLWKHRFQADEVITIGEIGETSIQKIIDKFATLNEQKKLLEQQMNGLKEFLEEYVMSHKEEGRKKIFGKKAELRVDYKNERKGRDEDSTKALKEYLIQHGMFDNLIIAINSVKLGKSIESNKTLLLEIANLIEKKEKCIVGWAKEIKQKGQ